MSGDKETRAAGTPGRARASAAQIKLMTPSPHEVTPEVIRRRTMFGSNEVWKRLSGTGDKAVFQLDGEH